MKHNFSCMCAYRLFALALVLMLSAACSQDASINELGPDSNPIASMTDLELLEYLGYDPLDATEYELYYTVGDEIVSKERLEEIRREPQTRMQYKKGSVLNIENQKIILSDVNMFSYQIRLAAEEWNKLYEEKKSNIRFEFDKNHPRSVQFMTALSTTYDDLDLNVERPRNGMYGRFIQLNIGSIWNELAASDQLKYLFMHALGHLVGFEHSLVYGDQIPFEERTVGDLYDSNSIMMDETNLVENRNFYRGFTDQDKYAIGVHYIYQTPVPDTGPEFNINCSPAPTGKTGTTLKIGVDYELHAVYTYSKCPKPNYVIDITKNGGGTAADYTRTDLGSGKIRLKFAKPGIYQVTATVTNATENNTITVSYNVPDLRPIITGPSEVELGKFYDFNISYQDANHPSPTFDFWWDEMVFDTGGATVQKVSAGHYRIRFDEPGGYRIMADVEGGTEVATGYYYVSVYYKPYWKVEKKSKRFPFHPGIGTPIKTNPGGTLITWNKILDEYTNTVYFYADEACTQQIPLAHDVYFDYHIYYVDTVSYRVIVDSFDPVGNKIARKGQTSVTLPDTKKTQSGGGLTKVTVRDPFYDIRYPENRGTAN